MNLEGKTLVVTGAAGALGRAVAAKASDYGARVIAVDRVEDPGLKQIDAYHRIDLLNDEDLAGRFRQMGDIDGLLNIAGGFGMGPFAPGPAESDSWDAMFAINVTTLRRATAAALPLLLDRGRGAIVNVGALAALAGAADMSAYCAAKAAVLRLTETLSEEYKRRGINVNAVLPSIIDTPANRTSMPGQDYTAWVGPEDLAEVLCFLASDAAGALHGALLPVRGLV